MLLHNRKIKIKIKIEIKIEIKIYKNIIFTLYLHYIVKC